MSTLAPPARVRGRDLLLAELTKIVTLPACRWSLLVAFLLAAGLAALDLGGVRIAVGESGVPVRQIGHLVLAPAYGVLAVAVFAAGSEYAGGQVRLSLLAQPARGRLFGAKLAAAAVAVAVAAAVCVVPAVVGEGGLGPARALAWVAACAGLALAGFGMALLARSALVAFAVVVAAALADWTGILPAPLGMLLPHGAALAALGMSPLGGAGMPAWGAFLALAGWCAVLLGAAGVLFARRDA